MCGPRCLSVASPRPPPPGTLSPPSHCRPIAQAREELWAAVGLRFASALRVAPTVAQQPQGLFSPRRRLPLYHLVAHEQCELFLRLRPALLDAYAGVNAYTYLYRARLDARTCVRARHRAARASGLRGAAQEPWERGAPLWRPPPPKASVQSLHPQASASRPSGLTSGPAASSPGLQARCAPRVVATLSALHRDPILLAGQAPPLRVELKVDRLGRLVLRAALRAALLGRRLRCRHFHADDLLLADV